MERRSLLRVLSWFWLSGFLLTALGAENVQYAVINQSTRLSISGTLHKDVEDVEWKYHNVLMGKLKVPSGRETPGVKNCNCKVERNGSLLLYNLSSFEVRTYTYSLYSKGGNMLSSGIINVTVLELVDSPVISYNCFARTMRVQCEVSSRNVTVFNMSCSGSCSDIEVKERNLLEMNLNQIDKSVSVMTCEATNPLSSKKTTQRVDCNKPSSFWSIYMILAVAGGGVAFIIFLILLTYCVKHRCCRRDRRGDVKVSYTPYNTQQRHLPQPPLQQNTQTLTQPGVIPAEHSPGQRNQTTQRKAPPVPPTQDNRVSPSRHKGQREPGDRGPQQNKKSQRPSLPSNHPSDQPLHPQPRNQSKPHQQPRRKQ